MISSLCMNITEWKNKSNSVVYAFNAAVLSLCQFLATF